MMMVGSFVPWTEFSRFYSRLLKWRFLEKHLNKIQQHLHHHPNHRKIVCTYSVIQSLYLFKFHAWKRDTNRNLKYEFRIEGISSNIHRNKPHLCVVRFISMYIFRLIFFSSAVDYSHGFFFVPFIVPLCFCSILLVVVVFWATFIRK